MQSMDEVLRFSTRDLGYMLQVERTEARLPASDERALRAADHH